MNPLFIHLGSGAGFFSGLGIVALAICLAYAVPNRWMLAGCDVAVAAGMLLVGLSSTPLPAYVLPVWFVVTMTALIAFHVGMRSMRARAMVAAPAMLMSVLAIALEAPHHVTPAPPDGAFRRLYVFGDSITAGIGREDGPRWPVLVQRNTGAEVVDLAIPGARVGDMMRVAGQTRLGEGLVIIEIGGNDMFRRTTVEDYERDLDALLTRVKGPGRAVVMFELPLVPFHAEMARAQRRVAAKHEVMLIPKRYFASVFAGADSTVDGLHLSGRGHQRMAQIVEKVLGESFRR
jgi:lysophospholipase L1-like esterase